MSTRSSRPTANSSWPARKSRSRSADAAAERRITPDSEEKTMADPMKIRATLQGDTVEVRVLMQHEMETGQRKDAGGKTIPAWHIQEVTATNNGKPVLTAHWGTAVSKNPFLSFK